MDLFSYHRIIEKNPHPQGRDLFIGDIHARYDRLIKHLKKVKFDASKDRLFCVGDLIDRHDDNLECVRLLEEPWFFSVLGNHEDLLIQGTEEGATMEIMSKHVKRGGFWAYNTIEGTIGPNSAGLEARALLLKHCCGMMTVETHWGNIGVVHAEAPDAWPAHEGHCPDFSKEKHLYSRSGYNEAAKYGKYAPSVVIPGIDAVVMGHNSSSRKMVANGNRMWIDTAKVGRFTILDAPAVINQAGKQMNLHFENKTDAQAVWM